MSLADELLADLEEGGEDEVETGGAETGDALADIDDVSAMETDSKIDAKSVRGVAKLLDSEEVLIFTYDSLLCYVELEQIFPIQID